MSAVAPPPAASAETTVYTPLAPSLNALALRCHIELMRRYATPTHRRDLTALVHATEACYARLHWLWHHLHQQPAGTFSDECMAAWQQLLSDSEARNADASLSSEQRGADALSVLDALCVAMNAQCGCDHGTDSTGEGEGEQSFDNSMAYCSLYCAQYKYEETRMNRVRMHQEQQEREAAEAAAQAAAAAASPPSAAASAAADADDDDDDCVAPKKRGEQVPPSPPMRRCHADGSCHLQSPLGWPHSAEFAQAMATAAGFTPPKHESNAAYVHADPTAYFPPFLLLLHSVFLLRMLFCFLWNEDLLVPLQPQDDSAAAPTTTTSSPSFTLSPSSTQQPFPSLTRLCLTFLSWPPKMHAAVHSFRDNLQYCCYGHMIVGLRGRGVGENPLGGPPVPGSAAAWAAAEAVANAPPGWTVLDGRVWRRAMDVLKKRVNPKGDKLAPLLTEDTWPTFRAECTAMLAAAPCGTMQLPFSAELSAPCETLFVLGDSHSLTLHSQWLFLLCPRSRQHAVWAQMRTALVVGLKAWHIGQVVPPASDGASAATSDSSSLPPSLPVMHQTSIVQRYASLIPRGATVLLVAGEIDCRTDEGIATAVSKGRYASVEEALHATVSRYLAGALVLARLHGWFRVMVHPVTPPFVRGNKARVAARGWKDLDKVGARATLIRDFNALLQQRIEEMEAQRVSAPDAEQQPRFAFLSFFEDLCAGTGSGARPTVTAHVSAAAGDTARLLLHADYTLEGMHLNTKYIPLIEREMEHVLENEAAAATSRPGLASLAAIASELPTPA